MFRQFVFAIFMGITYIIKLLKIVYWYYTLGIFTIATIIIILALYIS
jgi:hypothetical protein